tara:strand:- start:388 stop:552 length:165 start_codon:yes stop_codon:yes gene_type:complete
MKVINKITGEDVTREVITNIEKGLIADGYKLFKVTFTRDENGNLIKHKTPITHE